MPYAALYTPEPTRPAGGPQPGTMTLQSWICIESEWADDFTSLGIYSPRDICGNDWPDWECVGSQHAAGRAADDGHPVVAGGSPVAAELAKWLVKFSADLGIQEVITERRRWNNQTKRWAAYSGRSPHLDHVHWAQNAAGARYLTRAKILALVGSPAPPDEPNPPAQPAPPQEGTTMEIWHCTANGQRYAVMPDGLVRLTVAETNVLLYGGAHLQVIPTVALLDKLHSGKRVRSFVDAPVLGG